MYTPDSYSIMKKKRARHATHVPPREFVTGSQFIGHKVLLPVEHTSHRLSDKQPQLESGCPSLCLSLRLWLGLLLGALYRRLVHARVAIHQSSLSPRPSRLDPFRFHAESLQPALSRRGARDDSPLRV